jgi:hypothetical protein
VVVDSFAGHDEVIYRVDNGFASFGVLCVAVPTDLGSLVRNSDRGMDAIVVTIPFDEATSALAIQELWTCQ